MKDPTLLTESGQGVTARLQELMTNIQQELIGIGSAIDAYYKQHTIGQSPRVV